MKLFRRKQSHNENKGLKHSNSKAKWNCIRSTDPHLGLVLVLPPRIGFPRKGRAAHRHLTLRQPEARPHKRMGNGSWCKIKGRKEAQNLLIQTARERRADVLLISEQHKWSENSAWYQDASRRAGILVCSPDMSIGDFLETHAEFVWVEVARVRVYSCYFSPNDPFEIFETQISLLEESLR